MDWQTANVYDEAIGEHGTLGRETKADVVLVRRLRGALTKLNPAVPSNAIDEAIEELTRDRSAIYGGFHLYTLAA